MKPVLALAETTLALHGGVEGRLLLLHAGDGGHRLLVFQEVCHQGRNVCAVVIHVVLVLQSARLLPATLTQSRRESDLW